jgi:transposase
MSTVCKSLPDDVAQLKELLVSSYSENERLTQAIEILTDEVALWQKKFFGRKSEKFSGDELLQSRLFDEAESNVADSVQSPEESTEVRPHQRKRAKRIVLPDDLPTTEVVLDIPEDQKICGCGAQLKCISREESKKLDIVPPRFTVIKYIRPKYACPECEGSADDEHPTVLIAPPAPQIIPKGIPTAGMAAYIVTAKYCDGIPLYRQGSQYARIGIHIPRSTMCGWVIEVARKCGPLIDLMHISVRAGPMIMMDETTVQVLGERDRNDTTKSYMWVLIGGDPEHPVVLFQYYPSRKKDIPALYLADYHGYLQTDGYAGYNEIGSTADIIHVGCWAHARRKFDEAGAATKKTGAAEKALSQISKIYLIERELRTKLEHGDISREDFVLMRKQRTEPLLESLHQWLFKKRDHVLPSSLLGKAVGYTLGQWDKLVCYLEQWFLTPDTNRVENIIRPFCVGRRNWLFNGSPTGAHASAALYSLIGTAKANGIEPYRYLRHLFEQIPLAKKPEDLEKLLPYRIDADSLNSMPLQM